MTIVLAGNRQQFISWCQDNHISLKDHTAVYASSQANIRGIRVDMIVVTGTFWNRKDADEIYETVKWSTYR